MKDITNSDLIILDSNCETKFKVIEILSASLNNHGVLINLENYIDNVWQREELTSTGIGFGIAIPHGKCSAVRHCAVSFCRLSNPLDWESLDGESVDMVFLIAVPEECSGNEHLKIIAALSRRLIHEEFRKKLRMSLNSYEIANLINNCLEDI